MWCMSVCWVRSQLLMGRASRRRQYETAQLRMLLREHTALQCTDSDERSLHGGAVVSPEQQDKHTTVLPFRHLHQRSQRGQQLKAPWGYHSWQLMAVARVQHRPSCRCCAGDLSRLEQLEVPIYDQGQLAACCGLPALRRLRLHLYAGVGLSLSALPRLAPTLEVPREPGPA
jgi:hypothetical protein